MGETPNDIREKIRLLGIEAPINEDEPTKTQKAKDVKEAITSKDQAFEKAYELLCQITKMDGTDVMAGIALISAKRDKDYAWMAQQLGDFINLFSELKKTLEE